MQELGVGYREPSTALRAEVLAVLPAFVLLSYGGRGG